MTAQRTISGDLTAIVTRPDDTIDLASDDGETILYISVNEVDGDSFIRSVMGKLRHPHIIKLPRLLGSFSNDTSGMVCHGYDEIDGKFYIRLTDPIGIRNEEQQEFDTFEDMYDEHGFIEIADSFELFKFINLSCSDA